MNIKPPIFLLLLAITLPVFGQNGFKLVSLGTFKTITTFEKGIPTVDYGVITLEQKLGPVEFALVNMEDQPLWVEQMYWGEPVCGPKWPKDTIQKGDSLFFEYTCGTLGRIGNFQKQGMIKTNRGNTRIRFKGKVLPPEIQVNSIVPLYLNPQTKKSLKGRLTFKNTGETSFWVTKTPSSEQIDFDKDSLLKAPGFEVKAGKTVDVDLRVSSSSLKNSNWFTLKIAQETITHELSFFLQNTRNYDPKQSIFVDYPLLVIENCHALWPVRCQNELPNSAADLLQDAYDTLKTHKLVSIGEKGVQPQILKEATCMQGECGGNQVAFKLDSEECSGILIDKRAVTAHDNFRPMQEISFSEVEKLTDQHIPAKDFLAAAYYINADSNTLIQVIGTGYVQENDWPLYTQIRWVIYQKSNSGPWMTFNPKGYSIDFSSTNLPKPLSLSYKNSRFRVVWYHGAGLCCPSDSKAWITEVQTLPYSYSYHQSGKMYKGGLGQPCD